MVLTKKINEKYSWNSTLLLKKGFFDCYQQYFCVPHKIIPTNLKAAVLNRYRSLKFTMLGVDEKESIVMVSGMNPSPQKKIG